MSPITKKLDESTKKVGEVIEESNSENENNQEMVPVEIESEVGNSKPNKRALPNSSIFSDLMTNTLGRRMSSSKSLSIKPLPAGASIPGLSIYILGGDKLRKRDNGYELTLETYKALSYTG